MKYKYIVIGEQELSYVSIDGIEINESRLF